MAYIYVITNKTNGKQYVGKTEHGDPTQRFKEHLRESRKERNENRPLHRAINKYGEEGFEFKVLEEVSKEASCQREIFWIDKLNTYGSSGYNATKGGDGSSYLDHQKIIDDYKIFQHAKTVADKNECHESSVRNILKANNIKTVDPSTVHREKFSKSVRMIDIKTGEILQRFPSQMDAARYLIKNEFSKVSRPNSLSSQIGNVAKGKGKTCAGFKWEYDI